MKAKLVLVAFFNNGDIRSRMSKEIIFDRVIQELKSEGRELSHIHNHQNQSRTGVFKDGSKVYSMPFESAVIGYRFTHIYLDESILNIPNGIEVLNTHIIPSLVRHETIHYETSEDPKERFLLFNLDNNGVSVKKYFTKE